MRKYETIFICDPDLQEKDRAQFFDRVKQIVERENGFITDFDDWGSRKLAYEIRKKPRGHYVCMTYGGDGDLVTELERNFRLTDEVMKFMTIVLEKDITREELEAEAREIAENADRKSSAPQEEGDSREEEVGGSDDADVEEADGDDDQDAGQDDDESEKADDSQE